VRILPCQAQRFWNHVDKNGPVVRPELGPCWLWTAFRMPSGYGRFLVGSRLDGSRTCALAHRVALVLSGRKLRKGAVGMHRCDNPPCVRPDHLVDGSTAANNADMRAKDREAFGERHGRSKLNQEQVAEIRRQRNAGVRIAVVATHFGISQAQVSRIANWKKWRKQCA
jgi:hypothetical protein